MGGCHTDTNDGRRQYAACNATLATDDLFHRVSYGLRKVLRIFASIRTRALATLRPASFSRSMRSVSPAALVPPRQCVNRARLSSGGYCGSLTSLDNRS